MSETNCANCGAPIDTSLKKRLYCETPYPGIQVETYTFCDGSIHVEGIVRSIEKCTGRKEEETMIYNRKERRLNDKKIVEKIRKAAELYEDGAIIESHDELCDVIYAIRSFIEDEGRNE